MEARERFVRLKASGARQRQEAENEQSKKRERGKRNVRMDWMGGKRPEMAELNQNQNQNQSQRGWIECQAVKEGGVWIHRQDSRAAIQTVIQQSRLAATSLWLSVAMRLRLEIAQQEASLCGVAVEKGWAATQGR